MTANTKSWKCVTSDLKLTVLQERIRLLIVTLWVGSLWAIGYLAAPTLFATLYDRVLAGTVAGSLFRTEAWVSVTCALLLLGLRAWQNRRQAHVSNAETRIIMAMLGCTVIGYFCLQPFMAALREAAGPAGIGAASAVSDISHQFAMLHGLSMVFYLANSLLGAVLMVKIAGR